MKPLSALMLAAAIALPAAPGLALDTNVSRSTDLRRGGPSVLSASERSHYRAIFSAIDNGDWAEAAARLDGMREGPLHAAATAGVSPRGGAPNICPICRGRRISSGPAASRAAPAPRASPTILSPASSTPSSSR